jgi:two-component system sensor histidine kinase VicK
MLWEKGIPAKQRIKEIEQGVKREFVETLREPSETRALFLNLAKSAKDEILILFSTPNAFHRGNDIGLPSLLTHAASKYSVNVRGPCGYE